MFVIARLHTILMICNFDSTKTHRQPITNEVSTLCRHMQAHHEVRLFCLSHSTMRTYMSYICKGKYWAWCEANSFTSMLPKDSFEWQEHAKVSAQNQTHLNSVLQPLTPKEVIIPYTDAAFNEAAREWLIPTNKVRHNIDMQCAGVVLTVRYNHLDSP